MRPLVAEIRLGALLHNYNLLEARVRASATPRVHAGLVAVIKANAYGHGAALCGRALCEWIAARSAAEVGESWLGVTSVEEALELRRALGTLRPRVLVMSGFFPGEEGALLERALTPQVWEGWHLSLLDAAARRAGCAPRSVAVHLEIDTGMSRQGVAPGEALRRLLLGAGFEGDSPLRIEGVLTHFSSPEVVGEDRTAGAVTEAQCGLLAAALEQLAEAGVRPRWVHAGNSVNAFAGVELARLAAMAEKQGAALLVRPGLALYGVEPRLVRADGAAAAEAGSAAALEPVMRWKCEVTSLRVVDAGASVGYNETFHANGPTRLALLPVGYADGLNRRLSNLGAALIRGRRAPIVGRVSMDQTVVDVSGIADVGIGDEVVLLGTQGSGRIAVEELAEWCGTIPYEVFCGIGARVQRVAV
ncbi:alanine racemase [Acidipila sp. EB88]|uniref:alanine racemase n=1 Tax=Acidipila sp. EB88 TaxID=2305226 RepID=UPI000F5FD3DB|nr:alanine racemase [Acidipila sp. EB88]RRA48277.1 alanine racemase [Acidipila sp. EB88]